MARARHPALLDDREWLEGASVAAGMSAEAVGAALGCSGATVVWPDPTSPATRSGYRKLLRELSGGLEPRPHLTLSGRSLGRGRRGGTGGSPPTDDEHDDEHAYLSVLVAPVEAGDL